MPVLLQHHPWHNSPRFTKRLLQGLSDSAAQATTLAQLTRGVLLHGHLHRRIRRRLVTEAGHLDTIGSTSASLIHETDEQMAGFNLYDFADDGSLQDATSFRLSASDDARRGFIEVPIPHA
jgi:hypothetical protein